ncbi:MAG: DUF115 domain-containing protein [Campylobacterales bacterium]|nr:DUF115 domain-containing protein [Campylobacterales bacterium]
MNLSKLKNMQIYIAPYNNESEEFYELLLKELDFSFLGYIDQFQTGDNVHAPVDIQEEYDYIIILSPNYFQTITYNLISLGVSKKKIIYSTSTNKNSTSFSLYKYSFLFKLYNVYKQFILLSKINYVKLFKLKNNHINKRAFIIGNGPSLNISDLNKLQNEITFAANKIYLSFDETKWRPTYYFVTDNLVYSQNYTKIKNLKLNSFFPVSIASSKPKIKNSIYFNLNYKYPAKFNINPINGMYSGSTVVYVMLEFAIYMGIKELYIIGLDFSFNLPSKISSKEIVSEGEINHFHKEYRSIGEKWTKPNMQKQEEAFIKVKEYCAKYDIKIYNASRSSKLDVFEKVNFDKIF